MSERKFVARETQLVSTGPGTSSRVLWGEGEQRHGLWEMEPGLLEGVHGPETVVILHGEATVTVDNEEHALSAGDVFVLERDEIASWRVHSTVRKFFIINGKAE